MSQIVEAIYERGIFKLLGEPVEPLVEGQRVKLIIEPTAEPSAEPSEELLNLAAGVSTLKRAKMSSLYHQPALEALA